MIYVYGRLGNCLSELVPMVSIFTPTYTLWHDDYILVPIIVVLYKLKYYLAHDPLKTFCYTYLLFISCYRYILLFTTSQVRDKVNDSRLIAIYLKVLGISRRKCIESYDGHAKEVAIVI